jgi:hypothetical protein
MADTPSTPPETATTATTTTATPPNDVHVPTTQQEQAQSDPSQPTVTYYIYASPANGTPVGLLRMVRDPSGMRIEKVDSKGQWQQSNDALQDIYPIADPMNDTSLWANTDGATEQQAKQVYDLHFGPGSQKPDTPPTQTEQSPPASGATTPPVNIAAPTKSAFYAGLDIKAVDAKAQVHVGSYMRVGHLVSGYVAERRVVHIEGMGDVVDDVSVQGEPPISAHTLAVVKQYGLDRNYTAFPQTPRTKSLLGGAPDTKSLYQVNGVYTPARQELHKKLLDEIFAGTSRSRKDNGPLCSPPVAPRQGSRARSPPTRRSCRRTR